jgi:hypothetical protein
MTINVGIARQKLLEIIARFEDPRYDNERQSMSILRQAVEELEIRYKVPDQQILLDVYHGLFLSGHLVWGKDIGSHEHPYYHLSEIGKRALTDLSNDPVNREGYLRSLRSSANIGEIAESYLSEALEAFNRGCSKATAVMVGAALETMILETRDKLVDVLASSGESISKDLKDWKLKPVVDQIDKHVMDRKKAMPSKLRFEYETFWASFIGCIRFARNDAGHPQSIGAITQEIAHSSLLIFPKLAKLIRDLDEWIISPEFRVAGKSQSS